MQELVAHQTSFLHPETEAYYRAPRKKRTQYKRASGIHRAIQTNNIERINSLLDKGICPNTEDSLGISALDCAITEGKPEAVELLLTAGARITSSTLHFAIYQGDKQHHRSIIQLLLDHGASLTSTDISGKTPLDVAADCGHSQTTALLKSYIKEAEY